MSERDEVLARAKRNAAAHKFKLNSNKKVISTLIDGLIHNKHQNGEYYCPCKIMTGDKEKDAENICMCREAREDGRCVCGLFVKNEKLK